MINSWKEYVGLTKEKPPKPWLVRAVPLVENKGKVLDLGSGALNDSAYLLDQGFRVTAVDKEAIATQAAEKLPKDRFPMLSQVWKTLIS